MMLKKVCLTLCMCLNLPVMAIEKDPTFLVFDYALSPEKAAKVINATSWWGSYVLLVNVRALRSYLYYVSNPSATQNFIAEDLKNQAIKGNPVDVKKIGITEQNSLFIIDLTSDNIIEALGKDNLNAYFNAIENYYITESYKGKASDVLQQLVLHLGDAKIIKQDALVKPSSNNLFAVLAKAITDTQEQETCKKALLDAGLNVLAEALFPVGKEELKKQEELKQKQKIEKKQEEETSLQSKKEVSLSKASLTPEEKDAQKKALKSLAEALYSLKA